MGAKVRKNWIGRVKYKLSFGGVCGFLYGKHKKKNSYFKISCCFENLNFKMDLLNYIQF